MTPPVQDLSHGGSGRPPSTRPPSLGRRRGILPSSSQRGQSVEHLADRRRRDLAQRDSSSCQPRRRRALDARRRPPPPTAALLRARVRGRARRRGRRRESRGAGRSSGCAGAPPARRWSTRDRRQPSANHPAAAPGGQSASGCRPPCPRDRRGESASRAERRARSARAPPGTRPTLRLGSPRAALEVEARCGGRLRVRNIRGV